MTSEVNIETSTNKATMQKISKVLRVLKLTILICTAVAMVVTNASRVQILAKIDNRVTPEFRPYTKYVHYLPSPLLGLLGSVTIANDLINSSEDLSKLITVITHNKDESGIPEDTIVALREEVREANKDRLEYTLTGNSYVTKLSAVDKGIYNLIDELIDKRTEDIDAQYLTSESTKIITESDEIVRLLFKVTLAEFILVKVSIHTLAGLIIEYLIYLRKLNKEKMYGETL